jgi:hypothetical protein
MHTGSGENILVFITKSQYTKYNSQQIKMVVEVWVEGSEMVGERNEELKMACRGEKETDETEWHACS